MKPDHDHPCAALVRWALVGVETSGNEGTGAMLGA